MMCRWAYLQEIFIFFIFYLFLASYAPFERRNFVKIECTTEIICHLNPLNQSTEFRDSLCSVVNKDIHVHIYRKFLFDFFLTFCLLSLSL